LHVKKKSLASRCSDLDPHFYPVCGIVSRNWLIYDALHSKLKRLPPATGMHQIQQKRASRRGVDLIESFIILFISTATRSVSSNSGHSQDYHCREI
jgi:hypothetical protein